MDVATYPKEPLRCHSHVSRKTLRAGANQLPATSLRSAWAACAFCSA
jgi:hypothetical protein